MGHETSELIMHIIAVAMAVGVIISAYLAKNTIGGIIGNAFTFVFIGAAFLALPHFIEVFEIIGIELEFIEHNHDLIEHSFFYLGTGSFLVAFMKVYNSGKALSK